MNHGQRPRRAVSMGLARRHLLASGLLALPGLGASLGRPALAQEAFPTRPIQVINPYAAGGATDLLARAIIDNPPAVIRDGGVIKTGYDAELDELQALSENAGQFLMDLEAREKARTGLPNLKVGYNRIHGYFIELPRVQAEQAPADYIRRQTLKGAERFITPELKAFEDKALSAQSRALAREKALYEELLERLIGHLAPLQDSASALAELDVLANLAERALNLDLNRPRFVEHTCLHIEQGRHPVVEQVLETPFVANDLALDADTRRDLEGSAERCVARGGSKVLVEDLLLGLLERPQGLLARALQDAAVDAGELNAALQARGEHSASRNPVFAPELVQWLQDALLLANLELGRSQIDQAALILALLRNPLRYAGSRYQPLLARLDIERLKDFALSQPLEGALSGKPGGGESLLQRFTHNLTQQARDGKLDPVLCRDGAIRQMVDILARRRKNNPIVVGEAGVGKTAIVEGLASRIAAGEVPPALRDVELLSLDMGLLQAGASVKGEFERRLKGVIDEVKAALRPTILFIDEAHTLIGAGGQAGGSDAANLLKPALARGELRTIAATTWAEYKKYFEKDPALARRFQPVQLHEPSVAEAVTILRGLARVYEESHGIYLRDDAVVAAAELSARYLAGRQLPDKAVDVLDTACARVRISLAAAPESLERLRGELAEGERQRQALRRDAEAGLPIDHDALQALEERLAQAESERHVQEDQWSRQRELAERLLALRQRQLHALRAGGLDQPAEVLVRAQGRQDVLVAALFRADGPGAADVAGLGHERIVAALALQPADGVDGREIQHVEAHLRDARQHIRRR